MTHEAQTKVRHADSSTPHPNWNRSSEYLSCCCYTMTAECLRCASRCCPYNSSPIPGCKQMECDHLHLPCQCCQSQLSCPLRKKEAHVGFCASECQNEHVSRRSYGCHRDASYHDHARESRKSHLCCSFCCPCLKFPSKCRVIHNGKIYLHRCPHCVCCEFH